MKHTMAAPIQLPDGPLELGRKVQQPMTIEGLRAALAALPSNDPESSHIDADELLIAFINDAEVLRLYGNLEKMYA